MKTINADELDRESLRLLADARHGEPALFTRDGEPVLLTVPLGEGADPGRVRVDLAVALFDDEQISLGLAARIAGLAYTEMIDELGRRDVAVIRLTPGELERELAAFGD